MRDADRDLFWYGAHPRLHRVLGARKARAGWSFGVWAPQARQVGIVGDWNGWTPTWLDGEHGIWEGRIRGPRQGHRYKIRVVTPSGDAKDQADPFAAAAELPPKTASVLWTPRHDWGDGEWMAARRFDPERPMSVYEVHLGSWRRGLGYRAIAEPLIDHVRREGFTHVELLPITEHPFTGSWGYQVTGYFAPTARYGDPNELMALIDALHQAGIGVILDWVPAHFPKDAHALYRFDGTPCYEHADPRRGHHPDWDTAIFDYGRHEVRSFLLSSAVHWLERYHVDGLRVDAVASMLYLDYSRNDGEWEPNIYGGNENLEAIAFLKLLNETVHREVPGAFTIAEESTAWPQVTGDVAHGGLGFDLKWDLGWMHDTLEVLARDPIHRPFHHDKLTFRGIYAWSERFVLPLSHDEVVHGKGSLVGKMPGDDWKRRANLRLLLGMQWVQPGKKTLFMGAELAQRAEWDHDGELDWAGRDACIEALVARLNALYRELPALWWDHRPDGYEWIAGDDKAAGVLAFLRKGPGGATVLAVVHVADTTRRAYRVGVPRGGPWRTRVCTDDVAFGGSGVGDAEVEARAEPWHGRPHSLELTLPPLGVVVLEPT